MCENILKVCVPDAPMSSDVSIIFMIWEFLHVIIILYMGY